MNLILRFSGSSKIRRGPGTFPSNMKAKHFLTPVLLFIFCLGGLTNQSLAQTAEESAEAKQDYEERLEKYDFEADPKKHRTLASWCKRNYPEKYQFHQNAYHEYLFEIEELDLSATPSAEDFKKMKEKAEKLSLPGKARGYHGKWGVAMMEVYSKKLKPGDAEMMGKLLKWAREQKLEFIEPVKKLARELIEADADNVMAHQVLGNLQLDGKWQTPEDAFSSIDLKDPKARVEMHKKLAEARQDEDRTYPSNPIRGAEQIKPNTYLMSTPQSGGEAKYLLVVNGYSKSKPSPLIITLHGGGSGGYSFALEQARIGAGFWRNKGLKGGQIVIAPIARNHVANSWGTQSNFLDLMDAIDETLENFNIDRKRIYVEGTSMGGGGTSLYYLNFPEMAGAFCAKAGYYFRNSKITDVLDQPIMVIHGDQDTKTRNGTRDQLLEQLRGINSKLTYIAIPDAGHGLPGDEVTANMLPFFEEHENAVEPDFRLIRATGKAYFK